MSRLREFNTIFYWVLQRVITVLMGLLIVPVTLQIFSRYTELIPRYIWTEEVARFCLIWIIMLGGMIAVRDGTHFDLDILPKAKTKQGEAVGRMIVHVAMLLVGVIFLVYGWPFALFGWDQTSELTGLSMLAIHIAWPLTGLACLLFLGEKLVDDIALLLRRDA